MIREEPTAITQAMCDEAKGGHKHLMIAIGYLGLMRCYVDLTLDEAKRRYIESEGDDTSLDGVGITVFGFDDEFHSYEVSKKG